MHKNQSALMMSAIAVLLFACAGFGYSSMANRARAVKAESGLAGLMKTVDAGLNKNTLGTPAGKKAATAPPTANPGITNVQLHEPAPEGGNGTSNQSKGRNLMGNLRETDPERYAAMVEQRNNFTKQMHDNSTRQVDFLKKLERELLVTERRAALQQLAKQIGYRSDQTAQFEEYVKNVYAMTSTNPFTFGGGGRGGANSRDQGQPNRQ